MSKKKVKLMKKIIKDIENLVKKVIIVILNQMLVKILNILIISNYNLLKEIFQ